MNNEIKFLAAGIAAECKRRGPEYCATVARLGRREGKWVVFFLSDVATLRRAFPGSQHSTTRAPLLVQFWRSVKRWMRAGFPITGLHELIRRHKICRPCVHNVGFGIVGGCLLCRCSGAKLLFETERCGKGLW